MEYRGLENTAQHTCWPTSNLMCLICLPREHSWKVSVVNSSCVPLPAYGLVSKLLKTCINSDMCFVIESGSDFVVLLDFPIPIDHFIM